MRGSAVSTSLSRPSRPHTSDMSRMVQMLINSGPPMVLKVYHTHRAR